MIISSHRRKLFFILSLIIGIPALASAAAERDAYGGVIALQGKATGWFHVEQIGEWGQSSRIDKSPARCSSPAWPAASASSFPERTTT
jgi:hypothetical protein